VQYAKTKLGLTYVWGAQGPRAYDCSGLVQDAYRHAGISLPRTTYDLITVGTPVPRTEVREGDLVLSNFSAPGRPKHVRCRRRW
jgi:cell wall-associated NlpC family hydrolase